MENAIVPKAIEAAKRATPWMPSVDVKTHPDGSWTLERDGRDFASFTRVLSEAGIGPVITWGDIAMIFHGIPTAYAVNMQPNLASPQT